MGLPYYFNRYSFSQGVNGKESRVPTVEGVSFDERTGEFVIDDYPGDRARGLAATMFIGYLHGEETRYRVMELQGARDFGVAASAEAITLTIDGAVLITFAHPNYLVSIADAFEQNYSSFSPPPERETIEASSFTWLFQALSFNTLYIEPIPRNNCLGEFIDRDDFFVFPSAGGEILVRYADAGDNCRRNADLPPPATSLRATVAFAAGDFQIEWDAVAGAIYYKLYRSADGGSPNRVGGDIADLEFVDRGLAVGIRYAYQVRACNNAGCSPLSTGGRSGIVGDADFVGAGDFQKRRRCRHRLALERRKRDPIRDRARLGADGDIPIYRRRRVRVFFPLCGFRCR